jgi:hypothetical protein
MRRQSSIERPVSGHGSKGSPTIGLACLLRRIGHLVNPADAPDLVAVRHHADHAPPDGLEMGLDGCGARLPDGRQQSMVVPSPGRPTARHRQSHRRLDDFKAFYAGQRAVLL